MKSENKILYLILGIFIGGVVVGLIMYMNADISKSYSGMMSGRNSLTQNSNTMDAHFIEQMIPHHEDAITMSELALTKATRPEVKQLAQNIIDTQTKEIKEMRVWYKEWFGRELPTGEDVMQNHGMMSGSKMHMGMMGADMDLEMLEKSENFDREFLQQMIPHHQMAVMMASMLKNGTDRPEMKNLADNIISSQTSEIDQMRNWLNSWE